MKAAEVSFRLSISYCVFLTVCASTVDHYFMVYDSIFITIYIQKVSQITVELNGLENNLTTEV